MRLFGAFLTFFVSLLVLIGIMALTNNSASAAIDTYSKHELEDAFKQRDAAIEIMAHEIEAIKKKIGIKKK